MLSSAFLELRSLHVLSLTFSNGCINALSNETLTIKWDYTQCLHSIQRNIPHKRKSDDPVGYDHLKAKREGDIIVSNVEQEMFKSSSAIAAAAVVDE